MKGLRQELNDAQRRAVEYGTGGADATPLLVIAGAGSGKTSTLAHRVAHLVGNGADPQRLLLLTFSRRAAAELERRAGQALLAKIAGRIADRPPVLPWAGTFHSVGARILREYADRIGLAQLHDPRSRRFRRPDGLVRHEQLAVGDDREPISRPRHLRRHLFAHRQRRGVAGRRAARRLSVVRPLRRSRCVRCSGRTWRRSRRSRCSISTTCCCTGPG